MGALKEIHVPDIGDFKEVEVVEILVKPGDTIAKDASLISLESDKATMEIPSPDAGATTPDASPASTTSRPLSQRGRGFIGIGAPSRRTTSASARPAASRNVPTPPRSENPLHALPVPMLTVPPCGKIQP